MMEAGTGREDIAGWQEYRSALYRFILKRVGDRAAAEDIVQKVLLKALEKQGQLKQPAAMRAWLYQITRNAVIDHYRAQKPWQPLPDDLVPELAPEDESQVERELAECLVPLLDAVPEPYRQALELADFKGAKQREIASQLGISVSGAKSRVQRARKMLRDVLLRCCRVQLDSRGGAVAYEIKQGCGSCSETTS